VLSLTGDGSADFCDREGAWLIDQLSCAAKRSLHLTSAVRELRARFPRLADPHTVVDRLLSYEPSGVTLVWTGTDGRRVFVGYPAQEPALPRGQCFWLPGFDISDWLHNSRPHRPVPAGAA
jgi:hypothetical protein